MQESEQQADIGDDDSKMPFNLVHGKPFTRRHSTFQASAGWGCQPHVAGKAAGCALYAPSSGCCGQAVRQCTTQTPPCCRASLLSISEGPTVRNCCSVTQAFTATTLQD